MEPKKMKIFEAAKKNFASIYLVENKRPLYRTQLLYVLANFFTASLQCLYLEYGAKTTREYMNSIVLSTIGILACISYCNAIFKTTVMYDFIIDLEKVVNERLKYPKSKAMYKRTNKLTEAICGFMPFLITYAFIPIFVLLKAIFCFFMYFTTDLGPDVFELPFPTWLPFDWKNPIGYSVAIFLLIIIALKPILFIGCFVSFGIGSFLFSMSLANDLKDDMHSLNVNASKHQIRAHIHEQFIELIRFTNLKWLLSYFTEIYRVLLILLFLGCMGVILTGLLMIQIDLTQTEIDVLTLSESTILCICALILVFAACEFGQRFNNAFSEVDDVLLQLNFYLLPLEIQHMLPVVIMYAQEPLIVRFFGSICLTREQFKKVIRTVYQYFMILREFYN